MTRELTRDEIADNGHLPVAEEGCGACFDAWPCPASLAFVMAAALLDLREGIEDLELRLFSYATGTGQQTRPKSGREMAEQVANELRALLPKPTTERGAPQSE